ncbi:hypothetical protein OOT46_30225 [Aquabacterium sp. A7-Y]|uniref:hypothetical protein n=1 Tax=Aquabacterium sp. A7-Y TaxID=1349605 RepID=UPI00223D3CB2|nr:hypothetical protein [Aquabacterium sp. A7-Y]MCW7542075.1 hypothetical protein [Aquabacterium sp. A7-Y]
MVDDHRDRYYAELLEGSCTQVTKRGIRSASVVVTDYGPDGQHGFARMKYEVECNNGDKSTGYPSRQYYHRAVEVINVYQNGKGGSCGVGNPIFPLVGGKREVVNTGITLGSLRLELTYDSSRRPHDPPVPLGTPDAPSFGRLWLSSFHRHLSVSAGRHGVTAARGDGRLISFKRNSAGVFTPDLDVRDRLEEVPNGYRYHELVTNTVETYTTQGRLTQLDSANGTRLNFIYSTDATPSTIAPGPGYLTEVRNEHGRGIRFEYEASEGSARIVKIVGPTQESISVGYDGAGNLASLLWPDGKTRRYVYERVDLPWALTGVVDESDTRFSSFGYDLQGLAVSTEHAGGVNRYRASYASAPLRTVTETYDEAANVIWRIHTVAAPQAPAVMLPNGSVNQLGVATVADTPRVSSRSQPAGAGCEAATSEARYDAQGNVVSRDDFNGKRACYGHDLSRNLETVRVEGLSNTATCGTYTAPAAALPSEARKVSTQWHPDWSLPTQVAEPRRVVTTVYNGEPDPFVSNAIANCAPADAKLPDGKPIAVVCKRVEQATTDVDGSKAFSATPATGVAARQWSYTYNQYGQVLTEDGPRTDVADVTRYEYYPDTTAEWTQGDLKQVTNPAGQVMKYTKFNAHGQVLSMSDANGVVTTYSYDLRQRVKSVTVGSELTTYDYYPTGLLQRVTQPDGSYIEYRYDDAHRLVSLHDGLGNTVSYTLDNAGNRTQEEVKDPAGVLMRNMTRAYDALGRLQTVTGGLQ